MRVFIFFFYFHSPPPEGGTVNRIQTVFTMARKRIGLVSPRTPNQTKGFLTGNDWVQPETEMSPTGNERVRPEAHESDQNQPNLTRVEVLSLIVALCEVRWQQRWCSWIRERMCSLSIMDSSQWLSWMINWTRKAETSDEGARAQH